MVLLVIECDEISITSNSTQKTSWANGRNLISENYIIMKCKWNIMSSGNWMKLDKMWGTLLKCEA